MLETDATMIGFRQAITENDEDWDARLIFADYLDECGRPVEANGQRWQGFNHKRPAVDSAGSVMWYDGGHPIRRYKPHGSLLDIESDLPSCVYRMLVGGHLKYSGRLFRSVAEAELQLAIVLEALQITAVPTEAIA